MCPVFDLQLHTLMYTASLSRRLLLFCSRVNSLHKVTRCGLSHYSSIPYGRYSFTAVRTPHTIHTMQALVVTRSTPCQERSAGTLTTHEIGKSEPGVPYLDHYLIPTSMACRLMGPIERETRKRGANFRVSDGNKAT